MSLIIAEKHASQNALETLAAALAHELNPQQDWSECGETVRSIYMRQAITVQGYLQSHGVILARVGRPLRRVA